MLQEQIARIKAYALIFNPTLSEINSQLLDLIIKSVVNRAIVYMHRNELVETQQLPVILEESLASAITGTYNTFQANNSGTSSIKAIEDNGQRVEYGNSIANYFSATSDKDIFTSCESQLDAFRSGRVRNYEYSC